MAEYIPEVLVYFLDLGFSYLFFLFFFFSFFMALRQFWTLRRERGGVRGGEGGGMNIFHKLWVSFEVVLK